MAAALEVDTDPVELIEAGLARLAGEERSGWSGPARSARVLDLLEVSEATEVEVLRAVGDFDAAGDHVADGATSAQVWIAHHAQLARTRAHQLVRSARLARTHRATGEALAERRLSTAKLAELERATRRGREHLYADGEAALLDAAERLDLAAFATVARRWRVLADDTLAARDAHAVWEARRVHASATSGGTVILDGVLDPVGGATLLAALDALAAPDPAATPVKRTPAQRRADALVAMATRTLAEQPPTKRHATRAELIVDLATLTRDADQPVDPVRARCDLERVGPVAAEVARRVLCTASLRITIRDGNALDDGRARRLPSAPLEAALNRRDRRCRFPGCDRPGHWCTPHHVRHWTRGGRTDLANLLFLGLSHEPRVGCCARWLRARGGAAQAGLVRQSLRRLWLVQMRRHSLLTASMPRRAKRR